MKQTCFAAIAVLTLCSYRAWADEESTELSGSTNSVPQTLDETDERKWSFSASAYTYFVPDDREYVQPTFNADYEWLHLEGRYNYEDLETCSLWLGYNFSGGDKFAWEFTPMLGGVFGNTTGAGAGYKGSLSWWRLALYSEGEFILDATDTSDHFFYNWSELSFSPVEGLRFGIVTQRTRVYETDREMQRGWLIGFSYESWDLTTYVLDPDDKAILVLAVSKSF